MNYKQILQILLILKLLEEIVILMEEYNIIPQVFNLNLKMIDMIYKLQKTLDISELMSLNQHINCM